MSYQKHVSYHFEIEGEWYELYWYADTLVYVDELRKNGQEDCHFSELAEVGDGGWFWAESDGENMYGHDMKAIIDYLNKYEVPAYEDPE